MYGWQTGEKQMTKIVYALTTKAAARSAYAWFRKRSILSKITTDGRTKIEVLVPDASVSGNGPSVDDMAKQIAGSLVELLPSGTEVVVS